AGVRAGTAGAGGGARLRKQISTGALGWDAPARGDRARAGPGHADPADGRAIRRLGRADPRPHGRVAGRGPPAHAENRGLRHPQPAGGDRAGRAHRRADRTSRPDQGCRRRRASAAARSQRARGGGPAREAVGPDTRGVAQGDGRSGVRVIAWRGAVLLIALAAWELVARPLNPVLYIAPSRLPAAFMRMLSVRELPPLREHAWLSFEEIVAAYLLAVAAGVWIGFVLGLNRTIGRVYEPLLAVLYAIPSVVWYPSLMLFFGLGPASKIAFAFLLAF